MPKYLGSTHCGWCGEALTQGELFRFELEHAGWREGGLLAPKYPDFDFGAEPVPTCSKCLAGIKQNYAGIRLERRRSLPRPIRYLLSVLFFALLLAPFVACLLTVISSL